MNEIENLSSSERESIELKSKVWQPINGEKYYYIDEIGIAEAKWDDDPYQDIFLYEIGNLFRTEEEVEEEIQRRKILRQWEVLAIASGKKDNEWGGWTCYYSPRINKIKIEGVIAPGKDANIYFATPESLLNAIKIIGEENIKKYILMI